jgi:O-antigen ligase
VGEGLRNSLAAAGVCIASGCVLLLPGGLPGLALALVGLCCAAAGLNRDLAGSYLLLWGPMLLGSLLRCAGIEKLGTVAAYPAGLALLFLCRGKGERHGRLVRGLPGLWLLATLGVLCAAFAYGPMTPYAVKKLSFFVFYLCMAVPAFHTLQTSGRADLFGLGLFAFAAASVHLASIALRFPLMMPDGIFEPMGLREHLRFSGEALPENNVLAFLACSAVLMTAGGAVDRHRGPLGTALLLAVTVGGSLMVFSSGQRIWILGLVLGMLSIPAVRPGNRSLRLIALVVLPAVASVLLGLAVARGNRLVARVYEGIRYGDGRILELVDRDRNFDSALNRIREKPLAGHGLGGYYVDGYSDPGQGTYPHNLVLELLSETGAVGTAVILAPPLLLFFLPLSGRARLLRTGASATAAPLLLMWSVTSMASWDLRFSSSVFALTAVMWGACLGRRRGAVPPPGRGRAGGRTGT